jgi:polysaccharide deacetylase 2 family uncharacterized protein YibQ
LGIGKRLRRQSQKGAAGLRHMNRRQFLGCAGYWWGGALLGWWAWPPVRAVAAERRPTVGQIALIIDDIGFAVSQADRFLELRLPLSFSILPQLPHSQRSAQAIHREGHDIMLHQPMEPYDSRLDPGPGAVYMRDDDQRIRQVVQANLEALPYAVGVNNHMGSRFTASRPKIAPALEVIQSRRLFFVDSLTSPRSQAFSAARSLSLRARRRDHFLDTHREEASILTALYHLARIAVTGGQAIGIGHPFPETARAIGTFAREIDGTGLQLVSISRVLAGSGAAGIDLSPST